MSANKPALTKPGPTESVADRMESAEARKGTAAANPVLSLSPAPADKALANGAAEHVPDHRSPAEIEADIEQTRTRLAGTLDELTERLSPRSLLRRAKSSARGVFVNEDGAVRKDRAAMAAGSVLALIGGCVALRRPWHG